MLQNAYFLAKIGADTVENERNFAEILQLPRAGRRLSVGPVPPAGAVRAREQPVTGPPVRTAASGGGGWKIGINNVNNGARLFV